ncbi:GntR family transcriptional regulator [Methylobacterium sp. J-070]|uniref:GntR family transcriptional regulator n=1 Tax=Methylobacterium sp. J-070 TaxID=2836650 RepID=UPI001FBB08E6|nr:GntR family transcriptional regulator [Methylobacterium sp. J-070]MCJ2049478.1 GntR family transcriptional regulator [Methylobacterium sp. J-070]
MAQSSKQTQTDKLAADIADSILSGVLAPGARLDEHGLAERYAVSRTPVREAIRSLAAMGLVELRPRRSAVVAEITPEKLETMFVAMGELEATCARLSALSMTPIERRRLQNQHERMGALVETDDVAGFVEANVTFHGLIYAGSHNTILADMVIRLRRRLDPYRRAQFRSPGRLPRSQAEHDLVVQAIVSGNAAGAHAAMLDHVSLVEDTFVSLTATRAA